MRVAELIYSRVIDIKKQNPGINNIQAFEIFITTKDYDYISSGEFHDKWFLELKNNNFEVLAVTMYYDPPSRVITYAKNNQLPFPVILDFDKTIKNAFKNIKLTPTSILIDSNGKIINTIVGEINFNTFNKSLEEELKKII